MKSSTAIKQTREDQVFDYIILVVILVILVMVIYPLYFIIVASVSEPNVVNSGKLLLWPEGFNVRGYQRILNDNRIWTGYLNTIINTVAGTAIGTITTVMAGYSLSRQDMPFNKAITAFFVFTMFFSGGLIPTYLTVKELHLLDTRAIVIILSSFSVYNMIIARSFFKNTLSKDLREAAEIDGCSVQAFFFRIALPLSKAIMAVIALYYAIGHWNSFFNELIFLNDQDLYPLQLILREILLSAQSLAQDVSGMDTSANQRELVEVIKYGIIVISTLPVLCIYPFIQKYFVKGVMIGAVKG